MPDIPPRFSKTPPEVRRLPPRLGEHSVEVLREAGFTQSEIEAMLASGATAVPRPTRHERDPVTPKDEPTDHPIGA